MTTLLTIQFLVLATMLGIAVITDIRERRIPNALTVPGAILGLVLAALVSGGVPGSEMLGLLVALAAMLPLFAVGFLGAGDVKLFAAVGAFVGLGGLPSVVAYSGVAGGVLGLAVSARNGRLMPLMARTGEMLLNMATFGTMGRRHTLEDADAHTIPYGVAIAVGTLAAWFWPLSLSGGAA